MARLTIFGTFGSSGRIGSLITYRVGSQQYARSMPLTVRNPKTPLQEANRMKFAQLNRLAGVLAHVAHAGFARLTLVQFRRLFIRWNKGAVSVSPESEIRVDWRRLQLSDGVLEPPQVEVETDGREFCCLKCRQECTRECRDDDAVYAVVLDAARMVAVLFPLGMRRDVGRLRWTLPGSGLWEEGFVYVFAVGRDGKSASVSRCVYPR